MDATDAPTTTIICHRCWRVIADTCEDPCWELHWDDEPLDTSWPTCGRCLEVYAAYDFDRGMAC
jgi:hypothetical protein